MTLARATPPRVCGGRSFDSINSNLAPARERDHPMSIGADIERIPARFVSSRPTVWFAVIVSPV